MTTRRPLGSRFAVSTLAFALFASACAGTSAPDATVTATAPGDDAPAAPQEPTAQTEPAAAQTPAEAPEPAQDAQGDTSITAPDEGDQGASPVTPVPPAPAVAPPTPEPAAAADASPDATVALPSVEVVDLVTGENADLATLAKPGVTLVWFWAPH